MVLLLSALHVLFCFRLFSAFVRVPVFYATFLVRREPLHPFGMCVLRPLWYNLVGEVSDQKSMRPRDGVLGLNGPNVATGVSGPNGPNVATELEAAVAADLSGGRGGRGDGAPPVNHTIRTYFLHSLFVCCV